jgi:hypothetical protein
MCTAPWPAQSAVPGIGRGDQRAPGVRGWCSLSGMVGVAGGSSPVSAPYGLTQGQPFSTTPPIACASSHPSCRRPLAVSGVRKLLLALALRQLGAFTTPDTMAMSAALCPAWQRVLSRVARGLLRAHGGTPSAPAAVNVLTRPGLPIIKIMQPPKDPSPLVTSLFCPSSCR